MESLNNLVKRLGPALSATLAIAFFLCNLPLHASAATAMEANMVVIGSGVAGMSAGIVAMQKGASKVIVLKKQSCMGANSYLAGGTFYSPVKTIG